MSMTALGTSTGQTAGALARIDKVLRDVDRPLLMERSVKAIGQELRTGRFLVSFPRVALAPGPSGHLRRICTELGIPAAAMQVINAVQTRAVSVHLGYEPEPGGDMHKCYLEFLPADTAKPGLVFLAVKWRAARWVETRYWHRGGLSEAARTALVAKVVPPGPILDTLSHFSARPECRDRLLEIEEPASKRRSIDLNVAEAQVLIGDCAARLGGFLGGTEAARDYLERHRSEELGHLASGTARDGTGFATLYHGTRRIAGGLVA